jgi:hypothetical protein
VARFSEPTEATAGSQRWLQILVNERRDLLDRILAEAGDGRIPAPVRWLSPLREDEWSEYSDQAAFDRVGLETLPRRPLADFWPARGPRWDGLGLTVDRAPILVEAKAHESEVASDCDATGAASQIRIRKTFAEVQRHYGVDPSCDWTKGYYQYANRIAHLYLLREQNGIPAWLVHLYVLGDKEKGAASRPGWERVRKRIHKALGLPETIEGLVDAFVEAKELSRTSTKAKGR